MKPEQPLKNAAATNFAGPGDASELRGVLLLCLLAAVHVFVYSAAFPFFNNVDEANHFDLVIQYSQGRPPQAVELISAEAMRYIAIFGSQEFLWPASDFPGGRYPPPPWLGSAEEIQRYVLANEINRQKILNYEDSQPPLYYALAGCWWRIGHGLGFENGFDLYWLRFLNMLLLAALTWLGYATARMIFPGQIFLRLGVPALLAFMPQTAFYSIENDVLSPLGFGLAFYLLLNFFHATTTNAGAALWPGLALAAAFLTKVSNLPLVAVAVVFVFFIAGRLFKARTLSASLPALLCLFVSCAIPIVACLVWTKHAFGDFTGSAAKVQILGWTQKPFVQWWHHPIFTVTGLWTFWSGLMASWWQGEFFWHRLPLCLPPLNRVYAVLSTLLVGAGIFRLVRSPESQSRPALWFAAGCVAGAVVFLGFVSIIYDFHDCFYPSRELPYFTSGRLMLGALIPFMLIFVYGLDQLLARMGERIKFLTLAAMIMFMLAGELTTNWPAFFSAYNWFHI